MYQTATKMSIIFFLMLSLSFHPSLSAGFRLELIHRDSPLSPLYQPNLTNSDRLFKHIEITKARASYLQQAMDMGSSKARKDGSIRIPSRIEDPLFTVEIGLGTPAVKKTLIFDTGSRLTWTQCSPCTQCYKQNEALFNMRLSSTYKHIDRTHPLAKAFTCTPSACSYTLKYASGQSSSGSVATERFVFQSKSRAPIAISNIVFGCGTNNIGRYPPVISGVLAMNKLPTSFARQLEGMTKGRFSYCLSPVISNTPTSYVKFGDEAKIGGWWKAKKTPFIMRDNISEIIYEVDLMELSVNGRKLGLGRSTFPNGIMIDSGTSLTQLSRRAYSAVKDSVAKYLARFRGVTRYTRADASDLCYTFPAGFTSFPSMTFHLKGVDYLVPPSNIFIHEEGNAYCLAMMPNDALTILGIYQQRNVRMVFDLKERMLSFATEDCSRDVKLLYLSSVSH